VKAWWRPLQPLARRAPAGDVFLGMAARGPGATGRHALPPHQPGSSPGDAVAALLEHTRATSHAVLDVWLSGAWARPFVCGPLPGVRRWREAQAVAAALAPEATGLSGPCEVWLGGPVHRSACVAVAVPAALLDALRQQLPQQGRVLGRVRPWWSAAANAVFAQHEGARLVVVDDGEAFTSLCGDAAAVRQAATQWPAPEAMHRAGWLARHLAARQVPAPAAWVVELAPGSPLDALPGVPLGAVARPAVAPAPVQAVAS
jgi:hypothetical protein